MSLLRLKFFNSMLAFISNLITYLLLHTSSNSMIFKNENKHISRFLFKLMDFEIMFSNIILKIQTLCSSNASSQEVQKKHLQLFFDILPIKYCIEYIVIFLPLIVFID
jgi:hypothetical protein